MKMTFQEIRIIATGPCIANQLRDVNTICRRSWYIAAHVWKIYDSKIEVVPLIINFSTELTTVVKFEVYVQKWCGRSCIGGLFNFQLWRIYQWKKFCKSRIIDRKGGLMSYLRSLCLFAHSGVQHIFCFVFLRLVYPMLPVSLDCLFWLPLRYSPYVW